MSLIIITIDKNQLLNFVLTQTRSFDLSSASTYTMVKA